MWFLRLSVWLFVHRVHLGAGIRGVSRRTPPAPIPRCAWCSTVRRSVCPPVRRRRLPLAELEPLARARTARLLALHRAGVARQETGRAEFLAMLLVHRDQRPCDAQAQRARLPA